MKIDRDNNESYVIVQDNDVFHIGLVVNDREKPYWIYPVEFPTKELAYQVSLMLKAEFNEGLNINYQ